MPERWSIAEKATREKEIARAIRKAAQELPKYPTAASWKRYREALERDLIDSMVASARAGARGAGSYAGIEAELSRAALARIDRLAREQARLIANNSIVALRESYRKMQRIGLTGAETVKVIEAVSGLNRVQANAIVNALRTGLDDGKRFTGLMRKLGARSRRYLEDRAERIGLVQGRRAANIGAMSVLQGIEGATKRWNALPGACDVCADLDGTEIAAFERFIHPVTGDELYGADVHSSCRCWAEYMYSGAAELLGESEFEALFGPEEAA